MMATGYTIAAVLLTGGLLVAAAILGLVRLAVSATRPELLERRRRGGN
jgi:hypothetical protein